MRHSPKNRAPGFYLFAMDFMRDLLPHPLAIRGFWISVMCNICFSKTFGSQTWTGDQWARILGVSIEDFYKNLAYVREENIGDISDFKGEKNEQITINSRRMIRDDKLSKIRAKSGKKGGNPSLLLKNPDLDLVKQNPSKTQAKVKQNTDIDIEKEFNLLNIKKEKRKEKDINLYGQFQNVKLTLAEYQKLILKFGDETEDRIEALSEGIESKGYKYKSHYATILSWDRKNSQKGGQTKQPSTDKVDRTLHEIEKMRKEKKWTS